MAEVLSTFQLEPGAVAPEFSLPDFNGNSLSLAELTSGANATLIVFACNHCPFVIHLADGLASYASDYREKGVRVIAISSNDVENYPQDSPEKMKIFAEENGWDFPYLYDEDQAVAKTYSAACTPDFYLFDGDLKLAYAGQFDSTRPGRGGEVTGEDLRAATEKVLSGDDVATPWQPSSGCNIKWKSGNEPVYFGRT